MRDCFSDRASWIELDKVAFENNVKSYRSELSSSQKLGSVLKGNAYGHGLCQTWSILSPLVDVLFVIDPCDAFSIRDWETKQSKARQRIVVLGAVSWQEAAQCAAQGIEVVIDGPHWKEYAEAKHPKLKVHVHMDTGLGREGFTLENLEQKISFLKENPTCFEVVGVMSHFADVEDVTHQEYALDQLKNFEQATDVLKTTLPKQAVLERHIAQSASTMILNASHCDLSRVGIGLYGLWPSSETKISAKVMHAQLPTLKPALSWKCKSQLIKHVSAGSCVGYGCTYKAPRDLRVCLLPVGYFDGYPRLLSNKAHVLVNGHQCKVLGRVMMNHIVIDITDATKNDDPVVATLLGTDGNERISAEQMAAWAETINYEIVTRIGPHLKRIIK